MFLVWMDFTTAVLIVFFDDRPSTTKHMNQIYTNNIVLTKTKKKEKTKITIKKKHRTLVQDKIVSADGFKESYISI